MNRTAEIAGAGFAGLGLSIALATKDWQVRVHERSDEIREIGAGIFVTHNGLLMLDEYGVMERLAPKGVEIESALMINRRGRVLHDRHPAHSTRRMWTFPRQELLRALYERAIDLGVEVVTGSEVVAAEPFGVLRLSDGQTFEADLIVGADGHMSAVRNSLKLTKREGTLPTVSVRYLIGNRVLEPAPATKQYWSGRRRMAVTACAPDKTYVYLSCPAGDVAESQKAGWLDSWRESFPLLDSVFDVLEEHEPYVARYSLIHTHSWVEGSCALVGDAAHALPPTLGQGANLALVNGRSLATFLDEDTDTPRALRAWEETVRPITDSTQFWSHLYDRVTTRWPEPLAPVRNGIVKLFGVIPYLNHRMRIAERTPPVTSLQSKKGIGT